MKNIYLTFGLLSIVLLSVSGQELHTGAELFEMMINSDITYEMGVLEEEIPAPDWSENLNYNNNYRVIEGDQIITRSYEIDSVTNSYFAKAEKHFSNHEITDARDMYIKALDSDSTFFQVMTYIGQTYEIEGDFDNSIKWYKKAIQLNYIDYMAHW